jgi:hypothetical protein
MSIADLPPVLTVPEAGELLRISRTVAFEQARLFRETSGADGIPNSTAFPTTGSAGACAFLGTSSAAGSASLRPDSGGDPLGGSAPSSRLMSHGRGLHPVQAVSSSRIPPPEQSHSTHPLQPEPPTSNPSR